MKGNSMTEKAPRFCLPDADEQNVCIEDLAGKWIVLYFYPKDNTPGCTLEAVTFSSRKKEFEERNTVIVGISPDSPKSHCHFRDKHDLTVRLLSDESHEVAEEYGVWVKKNMFGKSYLGIQRSTFLIDPDGNITETWRKVKVPGHVDAVLDRINAFQSKK